MLKYFCIPTLFRNLLSNALHSLISFSFSPGADTEVKNSAFKSLLSFAVPGVYYHFPITFQHSYYCVVET